MISKIFSKNKLSMTIACFFVFGICLILFAIFDLQIMKAIKKPVLNYYTIFVEIAIASVDTIFIHICLFVLTMGLFNFCNYHKLFQKLTFTIDSVLCFCGLSFYLYFIKGIKFTNNQYFFISLLTIFIFLVYLFIFFWFWKSKYNFQTILHNKNSWLLVFYIVTISLITIIDKYLFGRLRPVQLYQLNFEKKYFNYLFTFNFSNYRGVSFNSGHVIAACYPLGLAFIFRKKKQQILIFSLTAILILFVAIGRVLAMQHWPSDVCFSVILAVIVYGLYCLSYNKKKE